MKRTQLPVHKRIQHTADLFGFSFPMKLEPFIYHITSLIAEDYNGGYWQFYTLNNGGFYMAPDFDEPFNVCCENGFEGSLSADALGITACMYAYSHLSFGQGQFAETCGGTTTYCGITCWNTQKRRRSWVRLTDDQTSRHFSVRPIYLKLKNSAITCIAIGQFGE